MQLPGDDIASGMPPDYTKAVTIQAPPEAVWPWLAQIGDHRAGFYSYDWVEYPHVCFDTGSAVSHSGLGSLQLV